MTLSHTHTYERRSNEHICQFAGELYPRSDKRQHSNSSREHLSFPCPKNGKTVQHRQLSSLLGTRRVGQSEIFKTLRSFLKVLVNINFFYISFLLYLKCSKACGGGLRTRTIHCKQISALGQVVELSNGDAHCTSPNKPAETKSCNKKSCSKVIFP